MANGVVPFSGVTPSRGAPDAPLQPTRASAETPTATASRPKANRALSTAPFKAAACDAVAGCRSTGWTVPPPSLEAIGPNERPGVLSAEAGGATLAGGSDPAGGSALGEKRPGARLIDTATSIASTAAAPVRWAIGRRIGGEACGIRRVVVDGRRPCVAFADARHGSRLQRRAPPQLPPVLVRPDRQPGRDLDAVGQPAVAGAAPRRHPDSARHRPGPAVRAGPCARAAGRCAG